MTERQYDPTKTLVWFRENEKYDGEKQPLFKGFFNISREQLEQLRNIEPDENGFYKFQFAAWVGKTEGTFRGTAEVQKPREDEQPKTKPKQHKQSNEATEDNDNIPF